MESLSELLNCLVFTIGICLVCLNEAAGKFVEKSWQDAFRQELGDNVIYVRAIFILLGFCITIFSVKQLLDWQG
jgi:hypothetical protein